MNKYIRPANYSKRNRNFTTFKSPVPLSFPTVLSTLQTLSRCRQFKVAESTP